MFLSNIKTAVSGQVMGGDRDWENWIEGTTKGLHQGNVDSFDHPVAKLRIRNRGDGGNLLTQVCLENGPLDGVCVCVFQL